MNHAEDGGVGADAEGERADNSQGKRRSFHERAHGVANISSNGFEHVDALSTAIPSNPPATGRSKPGPFDDRLFDEVWDFSGEEREDAPSASARFGSRASVEKNRGHFPGELLTKTGWIKREQPTNQQTRQDPGPQNTRLARASPTRASMRAASSAATRLPSVVMQ